MSSTAFRMALTSLALTTTANAARPQSPALFFGPTANLQPPKLAALVAGLVSDDAALESWAQTRSRLLTSGGALHLRTMALGAMSPAQQQLLAAASNRLNMTISVEAGGSMCGDGSGATAAENYIANVYSPFLTAGGKIKFLLLESVFSRTAAGCKNQTHAQTAVEVAQFAAKLKAGLGETTVFFLYDALPHFAVGDAWPPNTGHAYQMELGQTITMLQAAMGVEQVELAGYWADSPMEYSRDYPDATNPWPAGSGYKKIAAAVKLVTATLGLQIGKTFNSQHGGSISGEQFQIGTLYDARQVALALANGPDFHYKMVETWYLFPAAAIPEATEYTTANTTLACFETWD